PLGGGQSRGLDENSLQPQLDSLQSDPRVTTPSVDTALPPPDATQFCPLKARLQPPRPAPPLLAFLAHTLRPAREEHLTVSALPPWPGRQLGPVVSAECLLPPAPASPAPSSARLSHAPRNTETRARLPR